MEKFITNPLVDYEHNPLEDVITITKTELKELCLSFFIQGRWGTIDNFDTKFELQWKNI